MQRSIGLAIVFLALALTTGCNTPSDDAWTNLPPLRIDTNGCPAGEIYNQYLKICQPAVNLPSSVITTYLKRNKIYGNKIYDPVCFLMDTCVGTDSVEVVIVHFHEDYHYHRFRTPSSSICIYFTADGKAFMETNYIN